MSGALDSDQARQNGHSGRRRTNGYGNGAGNSDDDSWPEPPAEEPWPELDPAALCGVAGEIVESVSPATEGDAVAILMNTVIMFGNAVGRRPYFKVGATRHYRVEFGLEVGKTAKARKGTAHDDGGTNSSLAAPEWVRDCRRSGLSSGEGLIALIHDEIDGKHPGITDKRAMVVETEFANTLAVMTRDGNTLSGVMRDCWDCRQRLSILTKNSPIHASNPHVSILGHITLDELRFQLDRVHLTNGFANRFLIACREAVSTSTVRRGTGNGRDRSARQPSARSAPTVTQTIAELRRHPEGDLRPTYSSAGRVRHALLPNKLDC